MRALPASPDRLVITAGARDAQSALIAASTETANQIKALSSDVQRSLSMAGTSTAETIMTGAREAQSTLVTASSDAASQVKSLAAEVHRSLSQAGQSTAETSSNASATALGSRPCSSTGT